MWLSSFSENQFQHECRLTHTKIEFLKQAEDETFVKMETELLICAEKSVYLFCFQFLLASALIFRLKGGPETLPYRMCIAHSIRFTKIDFQRKRKIKQETKQNKTNK